MTKLGKRQRARTQATIRGVKGDRITLTVSPDPLDKALGNPPIPMLHILVNDGRGDTAMSDGDSANASVIGMFTLGAARKLHAALGALLATKPTRGRHG